MADLRAEPGSLNLHPYRSDSRSTTLTLTTPDANGARIPLVLRDHPHRRGARTDCSGRVRAGRERADRGALMTLVQLNPTK